MGSDASNTILRNAAFLLGSQGAAVGLRALYAFVMAKTLGPQLYGLYYYGLAGYTVILPLTVLGLPIILARELGSRGKEAEEVLIPTTLGISSVVAVVAGGSLAVVAIWGEPTWELRRLLLLFSAALVARSLANWALSVFVATERADRWMKQEASFRSGEALLGICMALMGAQLVWLVALHAVSWWAEAFSCWWRIRRDHAEVTWKVQWDWAPTLLRQGVPLGLIGWATFWFMRGPILFHRHLHPDGAGLGHLAISLQVLMLVALVPNSVAHAALPVLGRRGERSNRQAASYLSVSLRSAIIGGAAFGILGTTLSPELVPVLLGQSYEPLGWLLTWGLWMVIPMTVSTLCHSALLARGLLREASLGLVAGFVATTLVLVLRVGSDGASAALLAIGIGLALWALSSMIATVAKVLIDVKRSILLPLFCVSSAAAATLVSIASFDRWAALPVGFAVLLLSSWVTGVLSPLERRFLRNAVRLLSSRFFGANSRST
ncbi:MAG: hypothetical protein DWQ36_05890 [Acidobacteria bacterium]|nr:MAG: hypothetical protein DWQ30_08630 [Acidobacteriota bacterium]REK09789.1 MAG: hypothetical protein DWQ36_05890 [Acidobacteriota bacterium]